MAGFDANTKLLIHGNGADGAQSYNAETGQVVTFVATAQLDTAQKKFGASSFLFDGNSDSITLPDSDDWAFGTGDFTVDMWVRFNALQSCSFWGQTSGAGNRCLCNHSNSNKNIDFYVESSSSVVWWAKSSDNAFIPSINTWYHLAWVRYGNTVTIYVDGVSKASTSVTGDTYPNYTGVLRFGRQSDSALNFVNGWIDEIRVSNVARWTTNFPVPTEEYTQDIKPKSQGIIII